MGFVVRVDVREWSVRLMLRGQGAEFAMEARGVLAGGGERLHIAGHGQPLACEVRLQIYQVDRNRADPPPVGTVIYLAEPEQITGAVYYSELFDEILHRHRSGSVLPAHMIIQLEEIGETGAWDVGITRECRLTWVSALMVAPLAVT